MNDELFRIEFGAKSFRDYISIIELYFINEIESLKTERKNLLDELHRNYWKYEPEEANHLEGRIMDGMYELDVEFRHRFRSSIIIQLFSFLEVELKLYCDNHAIRFSKEYKLADLNGSNELDKVRKYLNNSAKIDVSKDTNLWNFINDFRKLRNRIVHGESNINEGEKDFNSIKKFSKNNFRFDKNSFFEEETRYKILLDNSEFLILCVNKVEAFLLETTKI